MEDLEQGALVRVRFHAKKPWHKTQLVAEPFRHPERIQANVVGSVIWRATDVHKSHRGADWLLRFDAAHVHPASLTFQLQIRRTRGWERLEAVQVADVWQFRDQDLRVHCEVKGNLWPLASHVDLPKEVLERWADRTPSGLERSEWPEDIVRGLSEKQVSGEARVFFCTRAFLVHVMHSAFPQACLLTFGAWKLGLDEGVHAAAEALPQTAAEILARHDAEGKTMHGNVYAKRSATDVPMWCGGFGDLWRHLQEAKLTDAPCYLHEFCASALLGMPKSSLNIISRCLHYCGHISPHFEEIPKCFFADAGVSFPGHCDVISWNQSVVQVLGSKVLLSDVGWEHTKCMSQRFGDKGKKDGCSIPLEKLSAEEAAMLQAFRSRVLILPGDVGIFSTSQFHASVNPTRGIALFVGFLSWAGMRRFARDPRSLWACGDNPSTGEALDGVGLHTKLSAARQAFTDPRGCGILAGSDRSLWVQICDQAEVELQAGQDRLYHKSEEVPVIPLELGRYGRGLVRTPVVLGASFTPATFESKSLNDAMRSYNSGVDANGIGKLLRLADEKLQAGCLFDHAYAQSELAERLHRHLFSRPCGPALWSQACCLSEAVSMELTRARSTSLKDLSGSAAWPHLEPYIPEAQACARARLDAGLALVKRALRAPATLADWPPPVEDLREADHLDALRRFRGLDALFDERGPAELRGGRKKRRKR